MDPAPPPQEPHVRHIAWNGLSLSVPPDWQPHDVEHHFLSLARHGRTTLECAWRPDPAEFSIPRRRAALERQNRRLPGFTADPRRVPARWAQVLAALRPRLTYVPFAWHGGCGALCHDDEARCNVEVRFLAEPATPSNAQGAQDTQDTQDDRDSHGGRRTASPGAALAVTRLHAPQPAEAALLEAASVLATLRLHPRHEAVPFRLHDLELSAPAGFALRDFTFRPGLCALHFRRGADTLSVERLSPANVVLQGLPLRHWAARRAGLDTREVHARAPHYHPHNARESAFWQRIARRPLFGSLPMLRGLSRGAMHEEGAAWLVGDENKLMAVCLCSIGSPAPDTMAALCASLRVIETD
ncbi:hypothetical protein [Nitratidesulfovibrio liaohensis]|uniref:Uncharacterized protein n=1 Tax=Nitratidesulfovibrio liaohensis TaxID=2604158 RepID=A0ABY9R145_9BACT|nr:hypothetical protein [Nitratidesulfovibrio liaohensis]WMW65179.1 hypothetical protein KPS_003285 [Nitratidesulfovibrio liaohensis]